MDFQCNQQNFQSDPDSGPEMLQPVLSSSQIIQAQGQPEACTSMNQNQVNKLEQAVKARKH